MSEKTALVSRILKFSCVDGPGNRLVLFLQGCNFNCLNCHNPHTINHCNHCGDCIENCPTQALSYTDEHSVKWDESLCTHCDQCIDVCRFNSSPKVARYNVTDVVELIRSQHVFLSGVTVSGGEATLQLPFITELFSAIKADSELSHLTCFIDSNGYLPIHGWEKVNHVLDGVMVDLKSWQNETHQWLVGRDNHRVIDSIRFLASRGKLHELRLLHIPNKSDLDHEVDSVIRLIRSLPEEVAIRFNAFQHHGVIGESLAWDKCSQEEMERFHSLIAPYISQKIILPSVYAYSELTN